MTKKFWHDFINRCGEVRNIEVRVKSKWGEYRCNLIKTYMGEAILSYKFNGDNVTMEIERKNLISKNTNPYYCYETEIETVTINRKDIVTLEFKKKEVCEQY